MGAWVGVAAGNRAEHAARVAVLGLGSRHAHKRMVARRQDAFYQLQSNAHFLCCYRRRRWWPPPPSLPLACLALAASRSRWRRRRKRRRR